MVVAATAGIRQEALIHHVWEKNVGSLDQGKRQFAAKAANSLSFWTLGMLPVHRSGSVYQARGTQTSSEVPQRVESSRPSEVTAPVIVEVHIATTTCPDKAVTRERPIRV